MEWIINQLRVHPELAIFLTLFAGFWLGRLKIGKFSLGTVTSVLLVGVLVGQLNITVDGVEYEGEKAGKLLKDNGFTVTWKKDGTVVDRSEKTNGVYSGNKKP